MIPWFVILISQIQFRKRNRAKMDQHPFKMPFAPFTNYLTIAFLLMVLIGMWINEETRISLIVGIGFLAVVVISYYAFRIDKRVRTHDQKDDEAMIQ
jgi:AAT family amino acid transporter